VPSTKTTSVAADASVPWNQSVELAAEKLTGSANECTAEMKTDDAADTAKMSNPSSLVNLAARCVNTGAEKRRAWADSPMEAATVHASSGLCYELDPTPQEAATAAAAAAATSVKLTSSDSGGEDSAKENKEMLPDRSDSGKGAKKKGL